MAYPGLAPGSVWIWRPSNAVVGENFRTLISEFETGAEQRRAKWDSSRLEVRFNFERATLTIDEAADLWRFYRHKQGRFGTFLLPTYSEITRLASSYIYSVCSAVGIGQAMDFTTDLRSHFPRFYVENNNGDYDFFHVASVVNATTVITSAAGVHSYTIGDVVYPVVKARFADELYSVSHLAALLTTVGLAFTEVRS